MLAKGVFSICEIADCGRQMKARGWCTTHYGRWHRHGDPNIVLPKPRGEANAAKRPEVRAKISAAKLGKRRIVHYCSQCAQQAIWKDMLGADAYLSYQEAKNHGLCWRYYCVDHAPPIEVRTCKAICAGVWFKIHPAVHKRSTLAYKNGHKEHHKRWRKQYMREHYIRSSTNGVRVKIRAQKRPHTITCEICAKVPTKGVLGYHHWDDARPSLGIWLCTFCHIFVTFVERGYAQKYAELKQMVTEELHAD